MQCIGKTVAYQISVFRAFVVVFTLSLAPVVANAGLACNCCHGMPPADSPSGIRDPATGDFKGNHQGHARSSIDSCIPCHGASVSSYAANHSAPPPGSGAKPVIKLTPALHNYSISHTLATYSRGTFFNQTTVPPNPLGSCSNVNCHFENTTPAWGTSSFTSPTDCDKCHGAPPSGASTGAAGSHAKHVLSYPGVENCQKCHQNNTNFQHATSAGNRPLNVSFAAAPNNGSGSYTGPLNDYMPSQTNVFGICNATYCHGTTMNVAGDNNGGTNITPLWGTASTGQCGACHGATTGSPPMRGSHLTHTGSDRWWHGDMFTPPFNNYIWGRQFPCATCHKNYQAKHVNGSAEWSFDSTTNPWLSGARYRALSSGSIAPVLSSPYGQCSNLYCHSIVQTSTGGPLTGLAGEYKNPAWGNMDEGTCGTCHLADGGHSYWADKGSNAAEISSGSHAKHLLNLTQTVGGSSNGPSRCIACHNYAGNAVLPGDFGGCSTVCHDNFSLHTNHQINIIFAPYFGAAGTYNGNPAPGSGYSNCSNIYCHSNGTSVSTGSIPANTTVNWGSGALACTSCHAYPPAYTSGSPKTNSHGKHSAISCDKCHYNTTSDGITITNQANHVNKAYNVNAGAGISFTYTFSAGGGTCSTISCHFNSNATWGGTVACGGCHPATNATMTSGSHATHLTALNGPNGVISTTITCDGCHGTGATTGTHAGHGNGVVAFADGNVLAATSVCDTCHSPGGPYDGVNDAAIGAKPNWSFRVYTGSSLNAGKDRWCVTCHDSGTSVIRGKQAPDLAGNNSGYGYYINGHGLSGTECGACHGLDMNHKIDGKKTFRVASSNYKQAYRLKDVGGQNPLSVPRSASGCDYNSGDFRLCFSCHNEQALMNDSRSAGTFDCTTNPYKSAPLTTTQHKNDSLSGFYFHTSDIPANIHWDHLVDVDSYGALWKPDGVGVSAGSCTLCHNPHGGSNSGSPAPKMTHGDYQLIFGSDANGDYGSYSGTNWANSDRCAFACHGSNLKYYRPYPYPKLDNLTLADNNPADPSPAEAGYTNARAVTITIATSGNAPTQMIFAEDGAFTVNSTGWIAYSGTYSYSLTAGDGTKTVYGRLKNAAGNSEIKSAIIILDQTSPAVPASSVTSPNGAELWDRGTTQNITWSAGGISDANLKASPLTIDYSTNSGSSYPNAIVAGVVNNGTYSWLIPSTVSTQARVRLTVTDKAGNQAYDTSNADFTIRVPSPVLSPISMADNNNADPSPADSGYTNNRTVAVTLPASNIPDQMMLAEDEAFTTNSTGWITYATSYNYTLTAGDGSKPVYAKVRNDGGVSATQSAAITLDTTPPSMLDTTLIAPNGAESWAPGSNQTITWDSGAITDANLKTNPISLEYSTDSGATWPNDVASGIANSGSFGLNPLTWSASYSARVRITATDKAGNSSSDSSDNNFAVSTPYIVTNTNDTGAGSLRQVLTDVIAAGGNNAIWFNIPGGSLTNGVAVITPASNLPAISQSGITIDGGSQAAFGGNTNPNGPEVRIRGTSGIFGSEVGFNVTAANTTIKNLQIVHFMYGVRTNSANTVIDGNHLGFTTDSTGSYGTDWNVYNGTPVQLLAGSTNATVGEAAGNFISCNGDSAISDAGSGARIMNNTIGLLPNGTSCKNNNFSGSNIISINPANGAPATNCLIQGNTICGDASYIGIYLGQYVEGCSIKGNIFGLRYNAGTWTKVGALATSIDVSTSSKGNNTIGGSNVASSDAVLNDSNVFNSAATGTATIYARSNAIAKPNKIFGNFIGTNPAKTQTFGGKYGVLATTPNNSVIGGGGAGEAGNVIANMSTNGVYMENASGYGVKISRNSFYSNGTSAAGSDDAIKLNGAANGSTARPAISAANTTTVTVGDVLSGETVEVYISDYSGSGTQYGEGKIFVGSAVSTGASVTVPVSGVSSGNWVTAIRILANQNTSPFSANVAVP